MVKRLTQTIQLLLTEEQKEQLLDKVKKANISLSRYLRRLVNSDLKTEEGET